MYLKVCGVNDAFRHITEAIAAEAYPQIRTTSRVGDVIQLLEPAVIRYSQPKHRVLFNQARDANPFGHLFESLWMLCGRNDVATVNYYMSKYGEITSDDGVTANGAYGYRWRHAKQQKTYDPRDGSYEPVNQLKIIIDHLKRNPNSRRAVLSMWNVEDDLLKIDSSKDVCCNLSATFQLRWETPNDKCDPDEHLDMTVFNRSNDFVLGALGANVVHFSFLQEYVAAHLGVEVGHYNQISTNLHCYVNNFKDREYLKDSTPDYYQDTKIKLVPLVKDPAKFDKELSKFYEDWVGKDITTKGLGPVCTEPFLCDVAFPMAVAYCEHKARNYTAALNWASEILSDDWRIACTNWLRRREVNYKARRENQNPYSKNEIARIMED